MEPSKVKIFYLRDKRRFPVGCVASTLDNNVLAYAVSVHNPKDIFSWKASRNIAEVRLAHPGRYTGTVECLSQKSAKQSVMLAILGNKNWPTRARAAAKLWLKQAEKTAKDTQSLQKDVA